jgi:hypothetical protein
MGKYDELVAEHQELQRKRANKQDPVEIEPIQNFITKVRDAGTHIGDLGQREQLRDILKYWGSFLYEETTEFPATQLAPYKPDKDKTSSPSLFSNPLIRWFILSIVIIVLVGIASIMSSPTLIPPPVLTPTVTPSPTANPASSLMACNFRSLYSFESGTMMGWKPQTVNGNRAVLQVKQSTELVRSGRGSLELQVELRGGDENNSSGEAFVDLSLNPPPGLRAPLNLENIPIVIWVYVPETAIGNPQIPNGVQVFVKDQEFRSQYGEWRNLTDNIDTDTWIAVILTPTKTPSPMIETDAGFDPSSIILVGIKIGIGTGSTATYTGSIWIDDVCWPTP